VQHHAGFTHITRCHLLKSSNHTAHSAPSWTTFCSATGLDHNPFLLELRSVEGELIIRSFLSLYQVAHWSKDGALLGKRPSPVVSSTVRDAASNLAVAFRSNFKQSPFHVEGSTQLLPTIRTLLKAFDNDDPPPQRQKAVTPKLLRKFYQLLASGPQNQRVSAYVHTADLVLAGAFFFAMRS
jgi:hypothetical protein